MNHFLSNDKFWCDDCLFRIGPVENISALCTKSEVCLCVIKYYIIIIIINFFTCKTLISFTAHILSGLLHFSQYFLPCAGRNAPCLPASWVDSGSVHPWHYVRVGHAAVPGADWLCCRREQRSCGPPGHRESGRPSQCDSFGSGRIWSYHLVICF